MRDITKGMILAAGLGTRLRPMTNTTPKPLIDIGGYPMIDYALAQMKWAGITHVVINLHHLGEQIQGHFKDGSDYGMHITYSIEEPILGTGGGIKKVSDFFGDDPFVVMNGDIVSDLDLDYLIKAHHDEGGIATLVLRPLGEHEMYTPIFVEEDRIVEFGSGEMMYTGIQVIEPRALHLLPENVFSDIVADAYIPAIKSGEKITAFIHDGLWMEMGSIENLEKARRAFDAEQILFPFVMADEVLE